MCARCLVIQTMLNIAPNSLMANTVKLVERIRSWTTMVIPLTHTPVVRIALVGVDITRSYHKSSMGTTILSTNILDMNVCILLESNKTTTKQLLEPNV